MIVIATDAPLGHRELERLAERAFAGIARTGSYMSHGSGDYAIAFSTHRGALEPADGGFLTRLFVATAEAVEEAVLNSLFKATTTVGFRGHRAEALPIPEVLEVLRQHSP
jgi:D-aminopeptidase